MSKSLLLDLLGGAGTSVKGLALLRSHLKVALWAVHILNQMEPFSTIATALGVFQLCGEVIENCRKVICGAKTIESELLSLVQELENLRSLMTTVHESCQPLGLEFTLSPSGAARARLVDARMQSAINLYRDLVQQLDTIVIKISGEGHTSRPSRDRTPATQPDMSSKGSLDRIAKAWKNEKTRGVLADLRLRIIAHQNNVQVHLIALGLIQSQDTLSRSQDTLSKFGKATDDFQNVTKALALRNQISAVQSNPLTREFYDNNPMPEEILNSFKTNIHFHIPVSVVSFFKGRHALLEELKAEILKPTGNVQKRFVIYGFPGSGKTQFCCKLAQDLRPYFWGIFYIDASSRANAEATMCEIAIHGKVAATKEAAKYFLTNLKDDMPWILIIDNADDEDLDPEDYFPPGTRECILITTRDSDKKYLGTIGSRFYSFERLADDEAQELLLSTAEERSPYNEEAMREAKKISTTLHCLPVALVLAAQTIRKRYASWIGYLNYFKNNRQALARKASGLPTDALNKHGRELEDCVYVNFESLLAGMETSSERAANDAFDIMQLFAFFHHRNIRRDILTKAVKNPAIEEKNSWAEQDDSDAFAQPIRQGLVENAKRQSLLLVEYIFTNPKYSWLFTQDRIILPPILRQDALVDGEVDSVRLDQAIYQLQMHSFISPGEEPETYNVHPLIHEWMRIRLNSPGRQAIWCEAAAIALAKCIILDTNALSPERVSMRTSRHFIPTQLLLHIRHVLQC